MKIINVSLLPKGGQQREKFPIQELLLGGTIDPVNNIILKRGVPYELDSIQFEILDAPEETISTPEPTPANQ